MPHFDPPLFNICSPCHMQIAIGMHSGEGEYVEFAGDCNCDGPVETWLQTVVDSMKYALTVEFRKVWAGY